MQGHCRHYDDFSAGFVAYAVRSKTASVSEIGRLDGRFRHLWHDFAFPNLSIERYSCSITCGHVERYMYCCVQLLYISLATALQQGFGKSSGAANVCQRERFLRAAGAAGKGYLALVYTVQEICTGTKKFRARWSVDTIALYKSRSEETHPL